MNKNRLALLAAASATVPGIYARLAHVVLPAPATVVVAGFAITSAAFLLLWACDAAQADVSQALAMAVVAIISVLPEYSVDMYFTWQAGKMPESPYAGYSVANMTGANRLVIGGAWALVAVVIWLKKREPILLENERRTEIVFLSLATVYAFAIPIKGTLAWYDMIVFMGLYAGYIVVVSRRPADEVKCEGPASELLRLPRGSRRAATTVLFVFSGGTILANAKPFCEGLIASGKGYGINEFFLVQWLGPVASEAPEFLVALMFALRGNGSMALGSLLSAKLNQWTLLVGMIPGVYAVSSGSLAHAIPMGQFQLNEILLTAAQSLMAVFLIANLRFSARYGTLLFLLFAAQVGAPWFVEMLPNHSWLALHGSQMHNVFSLLYLFGAVVLFVEHPNRLWALVRLRLPTGPRERCAVAYSAGCHEFPHCLDCHRTPESDTRTPGQSGIGGETVQRRKSRSE